MPKAKRVKVKHGAKALAKAEPAAPEPESDPVEEGEIRDEEVVVKDEVVEEVRSLTPVGVEDASNEVEEPPRGSTPVVEEEDEEEEVVNVED